MYEIDKDAMSYMVTKLVDMCHMLEDRVSHLENEIETMKAKLEK